MKSREREWFHKWTSSARGTARHANSIRWKARHEFIAFQCVRNYAVYTLCCDLHLLQIGFCTMANTKGDVNNCDCPCARTNYFRHKWLRAACPDAATALAPPLDLIYFCAHYIYTFLDGAHTACSLQKVVWCVERRCVKFLLRIMCTNWKQYSLFKIKFFLMVSSNMNSQHYMETEWKATK